MKKRKPSGHCKRGIAEAVASEAATELEQQKYKNFRPMVCSAQGTTARLVICQEVTGEGPQTGLLSAAAAASVRGILLTFVGYRMLRKKWSFSDSLFSGAMAHDPTPQTAAACRPHDTAEPAAVKQILGSDLFSLADFIAVRVAAAHQHHCCVSREQPAKAWEADEDHALSVADDERQTACDFKQRTEPWRILVAIGGIPGSGKSTLAARLRAALNASAASRFCECLLLPPKRNNANGKSHNRNVSSEASDPVAVVGMDGFHLTRAELNKWVMTNAADSG
ncbi:hypothetical protein Efla_002076 [Eimeria flavescens]